MTVIQPRTFFHKRKTLGSVKLDVATVMNQKNSQFYHKWAMLAASKSDAASGPTGYLKVDISVVSRGQTPKLPLNIVNDEIEGNLLTPLAFVGERQRAKFIFDIYKCDHLQSKSLHFQAKSQPVDIKPTTHIVINFAGLHVSTTVRKNTANPVFRERLTITDLFPPLCQRVKIEICFEHMKKNAYAVHHLNLKHISNDTVDGFLPVFGPAYIYFYSKQNLEGYLGSVLMSMRTEFLDHSIAASAGQKTSVQHNIPPIVEESVFPFESTFLFVTIFEANCILRKYHDKLISFRITFGNVGSYCEEEFGDIPINITFAEKPRRSGKNFYYLDYAVDKPCLKIRSKWPDFRKRLYHSNILEKISKTLRKTLQDIEPMFTQNNVTDSNVLEENLKAAIDQLFANAKKYLEIVDANYDFNYGSSLDKERKTICIKTINSILDRLLNLKTNKSKKYIYRHLDDIQKRIETLIEDAQPCWPDIFFWMTVANKKIGCIRIPAREIIFSQVDEEKGEYCQQLRPMLFTQGPSDTIICKVEVLMFLGLEKQQQFCMDALPKGFKHEDLFLVAEEKHLFEGKAYIFEGEIQPGFDESGLVDPFVQVSIHTEMKDTQTKKHVLVPLWDQTLTFPNLVLFGSAEYLKYNPPTFVVDMIDKDVCSVELVGRALIKPAVFFSNDSPEDDPNRIKMIFHKLYRQGEVLGELLAAFELIEATRKKPFKLNDMLMVSTLNADSKDEPIIAIPPYLKPIIKSYRVEVLFWGVRHLKRVHLIKINRPRVTFLCGNRTIDSEVIENANKFPNFKRQIGVMDVNMADQVAYPEAFQFKLFDSRKFGIYVFAGISISDTYHFLCNLMTKDVRSNLLSGISYRSSSLIMHSVTSSERILPNWDNDIGKQSEDTKSNKSCINSCWGYLTKLCEVSNKTKSIKESESDYTLLTNEDEQEDFSDFDWWTKFYASLDEPPKDKLEAIPSSHKNKLHVYPNELEQQPEFKHFSDILTTFEISKGKRTGDDILDEQLTTAIVKGAVRIYEWPPENGNKDDYVTVNGDLVKNGVYTGYPQNSTVQYILRVYCVRGINLRPKDLNGKSDPYIEIEFGNKIINDRENYVARSVNPIFGRCFEFQGAFPNSTMLCIRLLDYDLASHDDLIGETKIDIENRYYTKHRANCGIAESYFKSGYCKWRDQGTPKEILKMLCFHWGLSAPEYRESSVLVASKEFRPSGFKPSLNPQDDIESLSLYALRHWQEVPVVGFTIVPEHVETRSLFTPEKPGIEQGKIQVWIDIFPRLDYPVPQKVNITPRKPVAYELRVVIWNAEDIILTDDDFFSGEKKSDIYIKGYLDQPENMQCTDVHYRSLTGEGNFNWRFLFKFEFLSTENKMVVRKKSTFLKDDSESKIPCILNLTVWDNDSFSADDFLGSLSLELWRMPRGARSSKKCDLSLIEPNAKKINLFKIRRTKGWWPFRMKDPKTQQYVLAGKIEAEFEIVTQEESDLNPVGMGRQGPEPLPPPKRPETSFSWFTNPLKSLKHVILKTWRWKILKGCFCVFLVCFILLAVYTLPGALMQKAVNFNWKTIVWIRHGDRSQHRHFWYQDNLPLRRTGGRRQWFACSCGSCRNRSTNCKVLCIVLIIVLLLLILVLVLYLTGFFTESCLKVKRTPVDLEDNIYFLND